MRVAFAAMSFMMSGLLSLNASAQVFLHEPYGVNVTAGGTPIDHPFSGGFYNPIHQFVDIDGDADLDLFILDNNDRSVSFFRNLGTPQVPSFKLQMPGFALPSMHGWFRFADVNGDGKIDLLTASDSLNSAAIFSNTGSVSQPEFSLVEGALRDSLGNLVYTQEQCIPGLIDIDGDSDLDYFSLNPGIGTINFYENVGSPANFRLIFRTDFWQGIQICPGCNTPAFNPQHGQGTMYFADVDADQDFDMFYGDLFDDGVFFFRNIGTPTNAILDSVSGRFPPVDPVITGGFNQPTLADIDADGDLDLFVSVLPPFQQVDNFYFYENAGTPSVFNYQLVTKNFLPTLDVGLQSVPAFVDIDNDNDQDLYVGDLFGRVAFLRNTGTVTSPLYSLEDSAVVSSALNFGYAPAFADIDDDDDQDMFLGHFAGNIEFYRNTGTPVVQQFTREISFFDSVNVGLYAAPAFFDLDADGDLDLFVGKGDGKVSFFRNIGTATVAAFTLETSFFQNIAVGFNAKPFFVDIDNDTDADLLVGGMENKIFLYRNDGPAGNPVFSFVSDTFDGMSKSLEIAPTASDIDADGDVDLIVGQLRGGLDFYRNQLFTSVRQIVGTMPEHVRLHQNYPNPFNPTTRIQFEIAGVGFGATRVEVKVFNLVGEEIASLVSKELHPGSYEVVWDASLRSSGVYVCRLTANGRSYSNKLILLK